MKYRVYVYFKEGILDPEAEAIKKTVFSAGFKNISSLSRGKFFDIELMKDTDKEINDLSKKILSNPIIEEFKIIKIN
tara:strand:+ start:96 stop:326 length:231 start_codon:yes stop_codon:yes gene_type:complete